MLDCIIKVQLLLSDSEPYNISLTVALFRVPFSSFQLCDIQLCDQLPIHRILTINTPAAVDCPIFRSPLITPVKQRQLKLFGHARADKAKEYSAIHCEHFSAKLETAARTSFSDLAANYQSII